MTSGLPAIPPLLRPAAVAAAALTACAAPLAAQAPVPSDRYDASRERVVRVISREDVSGGGRFYYVIFEDVTEDGEPIDYFGNAKVIARGFMNYDGIDQIILAPQTAYRMFAVYAQSLAFGVVRFSTPRAGERFTIPRMAFFDLKDPDTDGDGLSDIRELVVGTNPSNPDTDGDGLSDGAEVIQGLNPLDGLIAATGVIASAPVPGTAIDICAFNNLVVVAGGEPGVAVFNADVADAPVRIAQVDTPGAAQAVAGYGTYIAVADGAAGLTIIDVSDPPAARVLRTVNLGLNIFSVATYGNYALAGATNGRVVVVDMISGSEISRAQNLPNATVQDMGFLGSHLYVFQMGTLSVFRFLDGELEYVRGVAVNGSQGAGIRRHRLFIGDGYAYMSFTNGYNAYSLANPEQPVLIRRHTTNSFGWKQIQSNGSGRAVVAVSANSTADSNHNIGLYDDSNIAVDTPFLTEYTTPGYAYAFTLFNGLVYVADGARGLQVVNYRAFDTGGVPPVVSLRVSGASAGLAEEGKYLRVEALATDDVLLRNVTFLVNGRTAAVDGNYPYEAQLLMPLLSSGATEVVIEAVARDTGGNIGRSAPVTLALVPDATPPRVTKVIPPNGAFTGVLRTVSAVVSEPIRLSTIHHGSVRLIEAGPDQLFGTADDVVMPDRILGFEDSTRNLTVSGEEDLPPGRYQLRVGPPFADLAGNPIAGTFVSSFMVFSFVDNDRDGIPDDVEPLLGLDPFNPDSNGNGIPDGLEDFDRDGLPNAGEIRVGTDPNNPDSNGNGIPDGQEDTDLDGVRDGDEFRAGTDPFRIDTDGDGIDDYTELAEGTDPLNPASRPPARAFSGLVSFLNARPLQPGGVFRVHVLSSTVSYVNGLPASIDEGVRMLVASPPASYVNGLPEAVGGAIRVTVASPVVSYRNQL